MRLPTWITRTRVILLAIIIGAAVLRLWHIGDLPPGLYPDEATNGNDALAAIENGFEWFYPNNNGREGLFINLQAIALMIAGVREPWVLRIVAALIGIATIPSIYLLGRELWNRRTGLLTAALLAGSFWHVTFSRIGFRAIMGPLLLTYGLALFLMGMRKLRERQPGSWWAVIGGALAGLGLHTYIAFRFSAFVFIAAAIAGIATTHRKLRSKALRMAIAAGIAAAVVASPLLYYFATHPGSFSGRAEQVSVLSMEHPAYEVAKNIALEAGMFVTRGDANWRHNNAGKTAVPAVLLLAIIFGAGVTLKRLMQSRGTDTTGIVIGVMIVTGAAPAVISGEGMPHALRSIMLIVPVLLLGGFGLERIWHWGDARGWKPAGALLAITVVIYGAAHTAMTYPVYARKQEVADAFSMSYVALGHEILQRKTSNPSYVLVPTGDVLIDGIPVAAQTTMFITGTATRAQQAKKKIFYVTSTDAIPPGSDTYEMK